MRLAAPAKVNLHLEVLRRRPDGYHEIETILQAVDLHDRLRMILRDRWTDREPEVELLVRPVGSAPDDATNLVVRAARLFCREQRVGGHADEIETSIHLLLQPDLVHMDRAARAAAVGKVGIESGSSHDTRTTGVDREGAAAVAVQLDELPPVCSPADALAASSW